MVTGLVFVLGQTFQTKHRSEGLILAKKVDCKFNQGDQPDKKRCDRQDWAVHCLGNTDQVAGIRESLVVFDKQSSSVKQKIVKRKIKIHVYAKRVDVNLYHVTKFSPYFQFTLYCFYTKISSFMSVLTIGIVRDCLYLLIFYSEKFST